MASNGRINVKDAVRIAVGYVRELYAPEELVDLRLEEVELSGSGKYWFVTIGFSRPELKKQQRETEPAPGSVLSLLRPQTLEREYKVVKIHAATGDVQSMKIRQV
jgi:hypothetical protein